MKTLTALSLLLTPLAACVQALPDLVERQEAVCGDAVVSVGEACDDGNTIDTDNCSNECKKGACGDGVLLVGIEECDDGTDANGLPIDEDACLNNCHKARCGDGVRRLDLLQTDEGYETCDDGNDEDTDDCVGVCVPARCGDGFVRLGDEACDDGNDQDTDACLNNCEAARCGDGKVWAGREACDDGNEQDTDACTSACEAARCGDGLVRTDLNEGEDGYEDCEGPPPCNEETCRTTCGNGRVDPGEECDGTEGCDDSCHPVLIKVAVGGNFICVVRGNFTVMCWGSSDYGQIGIGPARGSARLVADRDALQFWSRSGFSQRPTVVAGEFHACGFVGSPEVEWPPGQGMSQPQVVHCWGSNSYGQLARQANATPNPIPQPIAYQDDGPEAPMKVISAQRYTTCLIDAQSRVFCAGQNGDGRLTTEGDAGIIGSPRLIYDGMPQAVLIANGRQHQCFTYNLAMEQDSIKCWGGNGMGQLGNGSEDSQAVFPPVQVGGLPTSLYQSLVAGQYHTCALKYDGTVICWGGNNFGQVGSDPQRGTEVRRAAQVSGLPTMSGIVGGEYATCAWHKDRGVYCWGDLGFTITPNQDNVSHQPQRIEGLPPNDGPEDVALGVSGHLCILTESGRLFCRGSNSPVGLLSHSETPFYDALVEVQPWVANE